MQNIKKNPETDGYEGDRSLQRSEKNGKGTKQP